MAGGFNVWLTAIYASNELDSKKRLWKDIEHIYMVQQGSWCLIGDYNNVTKAQDRVGED